MGGSIGVLWVESIAGKLEKMLRSGLGLGFETGWGSAVFEISWIRKTRSPIVNDSKSEHCNGRNRLLLPLASVQWQPNDLPLQAMIVDWTA